MDKAYRRDSVAASPGYQGVIRAPSFDEIDPEYAGKCGGGDGDEMRRKGYFTASDYGASWGVGRRTAHDRLSAMLSRGTVDRKLASIRGHVVAMYRKVARK